ncbi:Fatty acid synthase subunit alpha [Trichophyton interdigitale]|nr:Fatty acid synthase subunit alpha [Trichophyton interdigitale]KAG5216648.1 Fatty acid synthase subunit alpha [Trichophyton interdigitale]KAG8205214.1 Fatty acid synthase subunit alpha [Trichophyton interdigitale]
MASTSRCCSRVLLLHRRVQCHAAVGAGAAVPSLFIADIVSDLAKFALELLGRSGSDGPDSSVQPQRLLVLNPLLLQGFREILQAEKLSAIDRRLSGGDEQPFLGKWEAGQVPGGAGLAAVIPRLCLTGLTFTQPFLLARIVRYVTEEAADDDDGHKTYRLITMLRSSLVPLIYTQTLQLDASAVRDSAALTLMSVDIERISSGLRYFHEIWASPIDIGLALWLLQQQLGVAAAALLSLIRTPPVFTIVCTLSGLLVAATMGARQRQWLEAIQNRVHATSSMLNSIKEIRLGGLQGHAAKKLQDLRSKEISESRPFKKALVMILEHGEYVDIRRTSKPDIYCVRILKGARIFIPRAMKFSHTVAGLIPTGWDARTYEIPEEIITQVDRVTIFTLVCTVEALISAGITDPYELYQYIHISDVAICIGSGIGGVSSLGKIFSGRFMDKDIQRDILQETFINTIGAWVNMLLLSASGPIRTPVGACATAVESLELGYEDDRTLKEFDLIAYLQNGLQVDEMEAYLFATIRREAYEQYMERRITRQKKVDAYFYQGI